MRNKVTKRPSQRSRKLPIRVTEGMDPDSGVVVGVTSQESIHRSNEEVDPDFDPKDSTIRDSVCPTKSRKKKKKKDVFEDSDSDVDEVVYQGTKVKSLPKKDCSVSLLSKVGKKKVPDKIADDNNENSIDNIKPSKNDGIDETEQCKDVGDDNGQGMDNDQNGNSEENRIKAACNVAKVGGDFGSKVDAYFAKIQAQYPNDRIPFMTNGTKLSVCLDCKTVPMLDKFDERLEIFLKENVLHANDRIVREYMLDPASRKPDEVNRRIKDSKILSRVNLDIPILGNPSINAVMDRRFFTVKDLISTMEMLVTDPKTQFDHLSEQYLKRKAQWITVIVNAKETTASVKRVWDAIQSQ